MMTHVGCPSRLLADYEVCLTTVISRSALGLVASGLVHFAQACWMTECRRLKANYMLLGGRRGRKMDELRRLQKGTGWV
jgi:hypothetical protein